ncbi:hypothetical protein BN7_896 [Wickerhamomyces ciferrii]|uniref:Uncharacterized protein n=1 Tax=Wickerhamomyces ciferrii (strain ATCC 14091 / BCRC 22168 / CBS 111 / JCM 3599 / NBRC 0793 / NRRL Y-1031 F-60-10) TaxID=1206466 RepID=K0KGP7_WICCF|nr:uncharacterized protein BN7_896 [Wickerhamomyces ciferrii]CCH41357.1 hypothetical protein BN7_896 [Wickerhamomyces ciferrii]
MTKEIETFMYQWENLNSEIMKHEDTLENQRRHLSMLNVSLNDRSSLINKSSQLPKKRLAIDLIAEEEEMIRELEKELSERQI